MVDLYFDQFRIHRGSYWDVYVSERGGNNLGRLYFWLHRDGIIDFDDLTDDELTELRQLHRTFKQALQKLFNFDGPLNFAYLANEEAHGHHCHYHMVPRYKTERTFEGVEFKDSAWGHLWESKKMDSKLAIAIGRAVSKEALLP